MTASMCATPEGVAALGQQLLGLQTDLAKYKRWAAACRQAARHIAAAETGLMSARGLASRQVTLEGPGAGRIRAGVEEALRQVNDLGSGLGEVEHGVNAIGDHYDNLVTITQAKIRALGKDIAEMKKDLPVHPSAGPIR